MSNYAIALILALLVGVGIGAGVAQADSGNATSLSQADLINQANAPISSIFQIRLQDAYAPAFQGQLRGQGNLFSIAVGMPLPQYRLLPFPQLSLLTIPAAVTLPLPLGSLTGFGDIRFVDLAVLDAGHSLLFGVGPTFVFPTASDLTTGQGKWQAGPAAAVAFAPRKWLFGILGKIQDPSREMPLALLRTRCFFSHSLLTSLAMAGSSGLSHRWFSTGRRTGSSCQSMRELAESSKLAHNT